MWTDQSNLYNRHCDPVVYDEVDNLHLYPSYAWLGLYDVPSEPREFLWLGRDKPSFTNWGETEEELAAKAGHGIGEDCVGVYIDVRSQEF